MPPRDFFFFRFCSINFVYPFFWQSGCIPILWKNSTKKKIWIKRKIFVRETEIRWCNTMYNAFKAIFFLLAVRQTIFSKGMTLQVRNFFFFLFVDVRNRTGYYAVAAINNSFSCKKKNAQLTHW